jgi:hypothetical protein
VCPTKPFTEAYSFKREEWLKKELTKHLRSKRRIRRSQHSRIFRDARGQIADAISIRGPLRLLTAPYRGIGRAIC